MEFLGLTTLTLGTSGGLGAERSRGEGVEQPKLSVPTRAERNKVQGFEGVDGAEGSGGEVGGT